MSASLFIPLVLLPLLILWGFWVFNRLVQLRNQVKAAWADIDVQLQRRHDLVPPLVKTVQVYAAHESTLLREVTELRTRAAQAEGAFRQGQAETHLEQALMQILALKEAYPDLKANENFAQLAASLVEIEDKLQYARRFYNGAVRDLNTRIQQAPDLFIAQAFRFAEAEFFQAEDQAKSGVRLEMTP